MRVLKSIPLKRKLVAIIMSTCVVALLLNSAAFIGYESVNLRTRASTQLLTLASVTARSITPALLFHDHEAAAETLAAFGTEPNILQAALFDASGQRFARYEPTGQRATPVTPVPAVQRIITSEDSVSVFLPIRQEERLVGTLFMEAGFRPHGEAFLTYGAVAGVLVLISVVAAFLISSRLQRVVSEPVLKLATLIRRVTSEKDYSLRATHAGRDEIGVLTEGFNEMLTQLQARESAVKAAHDELEHRVATRTEDLKGEINERLQIEQSLHQQINRISLLNQITRAIADRADLHNILPVVLRHLEDHLPIYFSAIHVYNAELSQLTVVAHGPASQPEAAVLGLRIGTTIPLTETVLAGNDPLRALYVTAPPARPPEPFRPLTPAGMDTVGFVPLLVDNKVFGVLVAGRRTGQEFSDGEREFLQILAEHVALAMHQSRLHSELQSAYTELRETQQAVLQQERLRALGQMASGIAHDINNALAPVIGFTDLVLQTETTVSDNGKKFLEKVKTAGQDIAQTVERLRDFYRNRLDNEPFYNIDANKLVQQVVELTRPRWRDIPQERGLVVEMRTELAEGLPAITGIESEIRQAVINLILNAVDALPNGGRLTLRTRLSAKEAGIESHYSPRHIVLEVIDTGVGMSETVQKRCLEPFFSTKGKRGTGLGLAMVYGVVNRHEARIEIESAPGQGTTMRLLFPVRSTQKAATPPKTSGETTITAALPPLKLLCIDDEPMVLEVLKLMLEKCGHAVEIASGGQAGIDTFREALKAEKPFDVVITDLGMPNMDGRQVAHRIKTESPRTPVVMLTGWGNFILNESDEPLHVDEVLSKPPSAKDLRTGLAKVFRKYKDAAVAPA